MKLLIIFTLKTQGIFFISKGNKDKNVQMHKFANTGFSTIM